MTSVLRNGGAQKSNKRARGVLDKGRASPKISISFQRADFNRIAKMAQKDGISFGGFVRRVVLNALS